MKVLITGGSGSFGRAATSRLLRENLAEKVVALARGEHRLAALADDIGHDPRLITLVGDVREPRRLEDALYRIDTVIHAAALKRVAGNDPQELMATNFQGTVNVVRAAIARGVERVVVLSTDKAASPCTAYGISKAAAEAYAVYANLYGHPRTKISVIRYGNVAGSQGSVIPLWRAQVASGQPLTITDERCTRFWITLEGAVALVLQTLQTMQGGEIVVPALPAASLVDLAEAIAGPDYPRKAVGLRTSEKIHELLLTDDESPRAVWHRAGYVIEPAAPEWPYRAHRREERVLAGFRYSSQTARRLSVEALRGLVGEGI